MPYIQSPDYLELKEWALHMPESEAIDRYHALKQHFGWAGTLWVREDVMDAWEYAYPDIPFDENIWGDIAESREWQNLEDTTDGEWEMVHQAVELAKQLLDNRRGI
jgi:hypothetical protein